MHDSGHHYSGKLSGGKELRFLQGDSYCIYILLVYSMIMVGRRNRSSEQNSI